ARLVAPSPDPRSRGAHAVTADPTGRLIASRARDARQSGGSRHTRTAATDGARRRPTLAAWAPTPRWRARMLVAHRAPLPVSRSWPAAEGVRPLRPRVERLTRWSRAEYCHLHRRADHAGKSTCVRHHAGWAQPAAPGARWLVLA